MTEKASENSYASYSAPKHHGECLIVPSLTWAQDELRSQDDRFQVDSPQGEFLSRWRSFGKVELLSLAQHYTASYRDVSWLNGLSNSASTRIVLSGHQPELFHCGVWFKNFLISHLAVSTGAIAINFIVDNDLCRTPGITLPTIVDQDVGSQYVAFDKSVDAMPWENRKLLDTATWQSFCSRVNQVMPRTDGSPMLSRLWQHAMQLDCSLPLGILLSQARHLLEADAGLKTLEVPLSLLCGTRSFAAFSLYLLNRATLLQSTYNAELDAYRLAHRIRNHAQPLPNLESRDGWAEVPWWCYTENSERRPMYVKSQADSMQLSDLQGWQIEIAGSLESDTAIEQWCAISGQGMRIRPRALMTTMFTRLLMSDLFVHGIGGGKYDQITDRMIAKLFSLKPPAMIVASATMKLDLQDLPIELQNPIAEQLQSTEQLLKSATANPELLLEHLSSVTLSQEALAQLQTAAQEKKQLLTAMPNKGEKWEWHVAMKKVKQNLSELAHPALGQLAERVEKLKQLANQQATLNSREFSYCLFDLDRVRTDFAKTLSESVQR